MSQTSALLHRLYKWLAVLNLDYILVCGDFNYVFRNDLDIISGEKHAERVVLKFNDLLSDCDLHDSWRLFHQEGKEYRSFS